MTHPDVAIVSFTGSTDVGRKVSVACAPAFKHCHLEMGGKNVIIVMDDARLDLAVEGALWGGFGTTGQRCTAASRVAVHEKVLPGVHGRVWWPARKSPARRRRARPQDRRWGPCINACQLETVESYVEVGRQEGAKLLCGGNRLAGGRASPRATSTSRRCSATAQPGDARRARGDLRPGRLRDPGPLARRGDRGRQLRRLRTLRVRLHAGHQQGLHGHARDVHRHLLRQRADHRRRDPPARSAAPRAPATATARPACRRWTSSPSGRASTSISAAGSSAPRSTEPGYNLWRP